MRRFEVYWMIGYWWRNYDECFSRGTRSKNASEAQTMLPSIPRSLPQHRLTDSICASASMSSPHIPLTTDEWPPPSRRSHIPSMALMLCLHPDIIISTSTLKVCCSVQQNNLLSTYCIQGILDIEMKMPLVSKQSTESSGGCHQDSPFILCHDNQQQKYVHGTEPTWGLINLWWGWEFGGR